MDKIIVTSKKVEEIKKFVRNLLDQKAYIDTRIREYQANVIDLYKVVLLEDYISGIQIMLRSIGIKYSLDDKQLVFDIDFTNLEQEYENPHNDIKTVFVELRKIIKDLMDKYDEPKNEEGQLEYEKKVVRN